jgi:hypothetical protein
MENAPRLKRRNRRPVTRSASRRKDNDGFEAESRTKKDAYKCQEEPASCAIFRVGIQFAKKKCAKNK